MADVWPTANGFPQAMMPDSVKDNPGDSRVFSEMSAGPPKVRARGSAVVRTVSGRYYMTATNRVTHETFFTSTLSNGVGTFEWPGPAGDENLTKCRYGKKRPVYTPAGPNDYFCDVEIMVLPT